jgi:hypothetical protein
LPQLEAALVPPVTAASKDRGRMRKWGDYAFQYQGRRSLIGKPFFSLMPFVKPQALTSARDGLRS